MAGGLLVASVTSGRFVRISTSPARAEAHALGSNGNDGPRWLPGPASIGEVIPGMTSGTVMSIATSIAVMASAPGGSALLAERYRRPNAAAASIPMIMVSSITPSKRRATAGTGHVQARRG